MSTEHTPGRIKSSHVFFEGGAPLFLSSGDSKIIARIENRVSGLPLTREDAENARRLAACWNACDGISTENLENITMLGDTLAGRFEVFRANERALMDTQEELLAALKEVKSRIEDMPQYAELTVEEEESVGGDTAELSYLARVCGEAIAKAEGGAA